MFKCGSLHEVSNLVKFLLHIHFLNIVKVFVKEIMFWFRPYAPHMIKEGDVMLNFYVAGK